MSDQIDSNSIKEVSWWQPVLFAAMAGGMAWGIRGQYGHETGAMIAGLLVSLTLVFLLCPNMSARNVIRAVAWGTVAMGFGGTMTYGQTLGLTQNPQVIGNVEAWRWGMLALVIKGGVWIGFAGVFLGMGLSGKRYGVKEMLLLMFGLLIAYFIGLRLLNSPFDPANHKLPAIYFSEHWHWEAPGKVLKPRFECWGGLLFALATVIVYAGWRRKDSLAWRLGLWGVLGGAIGFPLGQSIQSYHAWNPDFLKDTFLAGTNPFINWWNMMETTFGTVMGAALGLGLWLNRKRIRPVPDAEEVFMPSPVEWLLLIIHVMLLVAVEFMSIHLVDRFYDLGLIMGLIPMVAIAGGRWWPYLMTFPIILLPIAGKTVLELVYEKELISPVLGWFFYLIAPLLIAIAAAIWFKRKADAGWTARDFARLAMPFCAWIYFLLNYAFFQFPWPWAEWTGRTPNGIIFTVCIFGLTLAAIFAGPTIAKVQEETE